jgi:hypothetical protein
LPGRTERLQMTKPMISNEISPKFDRFKTWDTLPEKQLSEIAK